MNKNLRIVIVVALVVGIVGFQFAYDAAKPPRQYVASFQYPAEIFRSVDLGLHSAAASFVWLLAVQNIVFAIFNDRIGDVVHYVRVINELDPKFSYPYAFAALIFPEYGFTDEAIAIAEKGLRDAKPDWRIAFYLATLHHVHLGDRKNAAYYFNGAAITPGAPENIRSISLNYGKAPNHREESKRIWETIYETTDDELVRENAKKFILHFEILDILERAVHMYQEQTGEPPGSIQQLVDAKILRAVPQNPFGSEYYIDRKGSIQIR